jgi:transcriptional regulator GlxA family with amidase domain
VNPRFSVRSQIRMTTAASTMLSPPPRRLRDAGRQHPAVTRVVDYLEASAGPVSLDSLAGLVQLSKSHLVRLFRTQMGLPPHAYLLRIRISRACSFLAAGMPIAEAAHAAGFADQSHLTRHFKYYLGLTPGAYVRSMRPDPVVSGTPAGSVDSAHG